MTTSTFPTGISGIDARRNNPFLPCLVPGILENASRDREGPFAIAPAAILALLGLELAQMLKDEDRRPVCFGELDNASTHLMGQILIRIPDLIPESFVILLPLGYEASPMSVACNASKQLLPKAGYLLATTDKLGGQDRTFNRLDRTHR
jgi:hypothetical protein